MRAIEEIQRRLDYNTDIISNRVNLIRDIIKNGGVSDQSDKNFKESGPQIVALMLEAKSHSPSRERRREGGDDYQPFIVSSKEALTKLKEIICDKQQKGERFRFDFVSLFENHWTPMQIIYDGNESYLFAMDALGISQTHVFKDVIKDENIYSYFKGGIQKRPGCHIFAIQALNILNNMTILEKKRSLTGEYEDLDPRFFKITQSLSNVPNDKRRGIITKPNKEYSVVLQQSLDASSIWIDKWQNRFFDGVFYKYLLAAQEKLQDLLELGGEEAAWAIIQERLEPSDIRHNTYQGMQDVFITEEMAMSKIDSLSDGFEIGAVIRSLTLDRRLLLLAKAEALLEGKIRFLLSSEAKNKEFQIIDIIKALPVDKRAKFLDITDNAENTVFHIASLNGNESAMTTLLKLGANILMRNREGEVAMDLAPAYARIDILCDAAKDGDVDIIKLMLEDGVYVDVRDEYARTPLIHAARSGHWEVVELLLNYAAAGDAVDEKGRNALHWAVCNDHVEVVRLLLKTRVDINAVDKSGATVLDLACSEVVISELLKAGAVAAARLTSESIIAAFKKSIEDVDCEAIARLATNFEYLKDKKCGLLSSLNLMLHDSHNKNEVAKFSIVAAQMVKLGFDMDVDWQMRGFSPQEREECIAAALGKSVQIAYDRLSSGRGISALRARSFADLVVSQEFNIDYRGAM